MKGTVKVLCIAIACGMSIPADGVAQERVRVTLASDTIIGVVTRMSPQELELSLGGTGSRVLSRGEVLRTERGFLRSQWHWGYLRGSIAGFGAAVATFFAFENEFHDNAVLLTPLGLVGGGIAGSWIGVSRKREVWKLAPQWTGDRVRVTLSDSERIVGVVSRVTRDGLEVSLPEGPRLVAMGDVSGIERRTVQRQWKPGFLVGAALGGALGLLVTIGWGEDAASGGSVTDGLFFMSTFGAFYGFAGTLVGGLFKREDWESVQSSTRASAAPSLLVGTLSLPNGNSSFVLGAKLRF